MGDPMVHLSGPHPNNNNYNNNEWELICRTLLMQHQRSNFVSSLDVGIVEDQRRLVELCRLLLTDYATIRLEQVRERFEQATGPVNITMHIIIPAKNSDVEELNALVLSANGFADYVEAMKSLRAFEYINEDVSRK
jgi:hypothetical protein